MKIAVFGTGNVGQTLAVKLKSAGHEVMIGTRNVEGKLASPAKGTAPSFSQWLETNKGIQLGTFAQAAAFAEIILNATRGGDSISAFKLANEKDLDGKIIIDLANPLDAGKGMPPTLIPELSNTNSLGEEIQKTFPKAKVVKTLNTMWVGLMVNPALIGNGNHLNYISGNDSDAKAKVKLLLNEFGWKNENILDLGDITCARGTESYLPFWLRVSAAMKTGAFNLGMVK